MHEAHSTNGTGTALHEGDAPTKADTLRAEVAAHTGAYDQLSAEHAVHVRARSDARARRTKLIREQTKANADHKAARERRDTAKAEAQTAEDAAAASAQAVLERKNEALRLLRKAEAQLLIEEADRTPRKAKR